MASQEHLDILKQGVETWNQWRLDHSDIQPDFIRADLSGSNLSGAVLLRANLFGSNLSGASLSKANLSGAVLSRAYLIRADLSGSNLSGAVLLRANLFRANLLGANLRGAGLREADLSGATLNGTDLSGASVAHTIFGDVDLSTVKGLDTIEHHGPSIIGNETISRSQGNIPEVFLRSAGVMANQEHLDILKRGVQAWNQWSTEHQYEQPAGGRADLSGADLSRANLGEVDLHGADLIMANLSGADLSGANLIMAYLGGADLSGAILFGATLRGATLRGANLSGAILSEADLNGAILSRANLSGAILREAYLRRVDFSEANLNKADLFGAYLSWANLSGADLSGANLFGTYLKGAYLEGADLSRADLRMANLSWTDIRAIIALGSEPPEEAVRHGANLSGANLSGANLAGADLTMTNLSRAYLHGADLSWANLSRADFSGADLTGCHIYATSAWDVKLEGAIQSNLIIRNPDELDEPAITVDNLEVAQFIYLLLNNERIRYVIDTITSKAVLILGNFSDERKKVLDAIKDELRKYDRLPILFDFEPPKNRDLTETVGTLARISRFIIADITDPRSIPQELYSIIPFLPNVPVQPLLEASRKEYALFETFKAYPWVLPIYHYTDLTGLLESLKENIIEPAEQKAQELEKR